MTKLFSPGPVPIPDFVKLGLSRPIIHHRTPEFENFYGQVLEQLRYLFQTQNGICTCMGSGTYGVEMAIYSLFAPGEELLVATNGKFSKRWADYAHLRGIKVSEIPLDWGKSPQISEVLSALEKMPTCKGLVLTHSETSTGALLDLEEIAFFVKKDYPDILIVVDGITSIGALPYYHDDWGIDCSIVASQKALMNPAGLVAFAFSKLAESRLRDTHVSDFQNLYNHLLASNKHNSAFTPPVQLLFGLEAALKHIQEETLPAIWNRIHHSAKYFRRGISDLGGKVYPANATDSLSAFHFPNISSSSIKEILEKEYGLFVSGGQGELKGKILRVSHMGIFDQEDMREVLEALEKIIKST